MRGVRPEARGSSSLQKPRGEWRAAWRHRPPSTPAGIRGPGGSPAGPRDRLHLLGSVLPAGGLAQVRPSHCPPTTTVTGNNPGAENLLVSSSQALRLVGALLPPGAVSPCASFSDQWSHGDTLFHSGGHQGEGPRQNTRAPSVPPTRQEPQSAAWRSVRGRGSQGRGAAPIPSTRPFFFSIRHPVFSWPPNIAKHPLSWSGHLIKF